MCSYFLLNREMERALTYVNQLHSLLPDHVTVQTHRAELLSSLDRHDESILEWTAILEYTPSFSAHYGRGLSYFKKKKFRRAYAEFLAAHVYQGEAKSWNAIGKCLKEFGDDLAAAEAQIKALVIDPNHREAALDAAVAYMSQSLPNEATVYLEKALAIDPDFANIYGWRAMMYDNMGESHKVLEDIHKVLSLQPTQYSS